MNKKILLTFLNLMFLISCQREELKNDYRFRVSKTKYDEQLIVDINVKSEKISELIDLIEKIKENNNILEKNRMNYSFRYDEWFPYCKLIVYDELENVLYDVFIDIDSMSITYIYLRGFPGTYSIYRAYIPKKISLEPYLETESIEKLKLLMENEIHVY